MRKIRVNSKELMKALIAKGVTASYAAKELKMQAQYLMSYLQRDKVIQAPTANKLINYFGEQVVYIDEGYPTFSARTARQLPAEGKEDTLVEGRVNVDNTETGRHTARAEIDAENRTADDKNP